MLPLTTRASHRLALLPWHPAVIPAYLNTDWQPSDGCCLRSTPTAAASSARAPSFSTSSRGRAHSRSSAQRCRMRFDTSAPRLAIAGWFNAPPEGSAGRRQIITALSGLLVVGGGVKVGLGMLGGGGGN